ncbi:MAG: exosortase/archaeosortase family protein [Ilumatobacteraceae bacterium]
MVKVAVRAAAAATAVLAAFSVLAGVWRSAEAAIVVTALRTFGVGDVDRFADQIVARSDAGPMFLADIGPLCSSAGVVLILGMLAVSTTRGEPRMRVRAFARGALTVVGCNLARIAMTVAIGVWRGPVALEHFHDGLATAFAVVFLVASFGVFVQSLPVSERRAVPAPVPLRRVPR